MAPPKKIKLDLGLVNNVLVAAVRWFNAEADLAVNTLQYQQKQEAAIEQASKQMVEAFSAELKKPIQKETPSAGADLKQLFGTKV